MAQIILTVKFSDGCTRSRVVDIEDHSGYDVVAIGFPRVYDSDQKIETLGNEDKFNFEDKFPNLYSPYPS